MMKQKAFQLSHTILIILAMAMLIVACTTQEPVRIRVTATPQPGAGDVVVAQASDISIILPTDTIVPSDTLAPPTGTPIQTDGSYGPVISPNHTPPPTSTPRSTDVATELPTFTAIPQTPITTAISNVPFLDSRQMGIQLYYNVTIDEWWQWLRRTEPLDVGWIKVQANWEFLQPDNRDQFETAFSIFEEHVQRANNDGWRVLVSVAKAPDWARGGYTEADGPPADPQALAYFLNFMLNRMDDEISAIEVWNEPNLSREWIGSLEWSGAGYMQLFRPAYDVIRRYSPDISVVTAGLAPTRAEGTVDDRLFLQQMYEAGLGDSYYQNIAVGIHPYSWGNPPDSRCCDNIPERGWDDDPRFFFMNTLEDYRATMLRFGQPDVQLWATEFGWATWQGIPNQAPEAWMNYNTPELQAEYTIRAFQIGQSLDYVGPMFLWNMNFANNTLVEERNEMAAYSLFIPNVAVRPLYEQLQNRPR
jgi:polysaccharide biosynthesis protein PslG